MVTVITTTRPKDVAYNNVLIQMLNTLGYSPTFVSYQNGLKQIAQTPSKHVIIAGVPYHYPSALAEELSQYIAPWLEKIEVPVPGICLGHQAMGLVFGATMRRNMEVENGTVRSRDN